MKAPFAWDHHSDQPYQIKDRSYKKAMRRKNWFSLLKTVLISLLVIPLAMFTMLFTRRRSASDHFFGLGVDPIREPEQTRLLIEELDPSSLLIRFPLWEMENLAMYQAFTKNFSSKKIVMVIMQDREHIEDHKLLYDDLDTVFSAFAESVDLFQIGTTINRAKWGFFSVDEYLHFYQTADQLRQEHFPQLAFIGSGVIDFEYHFTAHTLFNGFKLHYDGIAALLYVDRRGAPEQTQIGFNLKHKIGLLKAMTQLSRKTDDRVYITETNWPLTGTAPYAPTSEHECVDEEHYADYLVRYYLIAWATGMVESVHWHQLIAPGYGLVDNRNGLQKRTAFYAFKTMVNLLVDAVYQDYRISGHKHTLTCQTPNGTMLATWSLQTTRLTFEQPIRIIDRDGHETRKDVLDINSSPVYLFPEEPTA